MTSLRKEAISLLEQIPENKLYYIVQIMEGVNALYGSEGASGKKQAFQTLEKLRKKEAFVLDYDRELQSYREDKYGNACVD